MISKAQERTLRGEIAREIPAKMSALERGMIRWAMVEPDERVLDANVGMGLIAEYLKRNAQCDVCGVSDNMEDVKQARMRLQSCDIVYATAGDIPWREGSFDTAMMRMGAMEPEDVAKRIAELSRVLKQGGKLILGLRTLLVREPSGSPEATDEARVPSRRELESLLEKLGFTKLTYQRVGLLSGVLIAWKRKQSVEEALEAQ